jgi:carbohydrate kinase (thermoresistant glucokinase family)
MSKMFLSLSNLKRRILYFTFNVIMNRIIYIMGVSGCGKSTIGELLSKKTGISFFDGDDFHPPANKEKMKAGQPLDDEDRKGWLDQINELALKQMKLKGAIIACSALKEKYRNQIEKGMTVAPVWIFLQGDYDIVYERLKKRKGHYMPVQLLASQFETLEIPANAFFIDVTKDPEEIIEIICQHLETKKFKW